MIKAIATNSESSKREMLARNRRISNLPALFFIWVKQIEAKAMLNSHNPNNAQKLINLKTLKNSVIAVNKRPQRTEADRKEARQDGAGWDF